MLTGGLKEFCSEQLTIPQGATSTAQGPAMGNADGQATHFRTDYQTAGSEQRLSSHWSFFSSIEQTNADQTITPLADAVTSNQQRLNAGFNYLFQAQINSEFYSIARAAKEIMTLAVIFLTRVMALVH